MYSHRKGFLLGFHGCDRSIRDKIVSEKGVILQPSINDYDWLGNGCYFWENSPSRAMEYAYFLQKERKKIEEPAVLGCVIDLGLCFDLTDFQNLEYLKDAYDLLTDITIKQGNSLPQNKTALKNNTDFLLRYLDCAVIETALNFFKQKYNLDYDSVRGVFFEGEELYPNAGFKSKNHIQIAIRNQNCIKGYFIPRELDYNFKKI